MTIDSTPPTSHVNPLPAMSPAYFWVRWSGADDGSGVGTFTIYVSEDGGVSWKAWLSNTTKTAAVYPGRAGETYQFFATATDNSGGTEIKTATADATTQTTTGSQFQGSVVVAKNDPVPGVSDAKFLLANSPAVDASGNVAFKALITGVSKTSGISKSNNAGIWRYTGTNGTLLARTDTSAADTAGALHSSLSDPAMHAEGTLVFTGSIKGGDVTKKPDNSAGVWLVENGTTRLIVRKGGAAAGQANTNYHLFSQIVAQQPEDVAFLATLSGSGAKASSKLGLWGADLSGDLRARGVARPSREVVTRRWRRR